MRRPRATAALWLSVPALLFAALVAWALASPVGSSPDEDFHLASIWCAQGERDAACDDPTGDAALAPSAVVDSARCFAFDGAQSAACQEEYVGDPAELVPTSRGNFTGIYPPVFFAAHSVLVGPGVATSVMVMRLVNAGIFLLSAAVLWSLLPARHRPALVLAPLVGMVPLGISLIPSVNPSSWSLLAPTGVFLALLAAFEVAGWARTALYATSLVLAVAGAGARADTAAYVAVAAVAAVVMTIGRDGLGRRALAVLPVLAVAVATLLTARQSPVSLAAGSPPPGAVSAVSAGSAASGGAGGADAPTVGEILLEVPDRWLGAFGTWRLGWFDTTVPTVVVVLAFGTFAALTFAGLRRAGFAKKVALGCVLAALWLFPAAVGLGAGDLGGVQPRYVLPLLWLLAAVALTGEPYGRVALSRAQLLVVAYGLSLAHAVALHAQIRRYVTGQDVVALDLDAGAEWWWEIPVSPHATWVAGSLAFLAASVLAAWLTARVTAGPAAAAAPERTATGGHTPGAAPSDGGAPPSAGRAGAGH